MSTLHRRLDSLEAIAEEARLRPYRILAEKYRIPLDALMRNVERVQAKRDRLRAEGLTDDEIDEQTAADLGITRDELRRRAAEIAARLS